MRGSARSIPALTWMTVTDGSYHVVQPASREAVAEVEVLHVHPVALVEEPDLVQRRAAHQHEGAVDRVDRPALDVGSPVRRRARRRAGPSADPGEVTERAERCRERALARRGRRFRPRVAGGSRRCRPRAARPSARASRRARRASPACPGSARARNGALPRRMAMLFAARSRGSRRRDQARPRGTRGGPARRSRRPRRCRRRAPCTRPAGSTRARTSAARTRSRPRYATITTSRPGALRP